MKHNRSIFILAAALLVGNAALAQDKTAVKYGNLITKEDAYKHLSVLASDEYEGRETGKPGAWKAAEYIAAQFKSLGLKAPVNGSYFQKVPLVEIAPGNSSLKVGKESFTNFKDFYTSSSKIDFTKSITEVIFVGYGIEDEKFNELAGLDLKGKVVLYSTEKEPFVNGKSIITGTEKTSSWTAAKRLRNLQSKNPALIISFNADLESNLKRMASYLQTPRLILDKPNQPVQASVITVSKAVADAILAKTKSSITSLTASIASSGKPASKAVKTNLQASVLSKVSSARAENVMGLLEGSDLKDEIVVVSGHYDHIGLTKEGADKVNNGADDDGSGTTGVLEMAQAFTKAKAEGHGPRRSILFLTVCGEEKGLLGSEWYSESPVLPLEKTVTDLNIDMIGRVDPAHKDNPEYVYLIGSDKLSTDLHKISEYTNATYSRLTIDYKYNDPNDPERIYYRSDHYNFAKHGIPIIFYFNGVHEDYHKPSDEVSKINFDMLAKRARLVFFTAWDIANRDKAPVVDVKNDFPADR
ncbi:MAG: M28 family peptidase [Sphingobacteriaceae bacterium]